MWHALRAELAYFRPWLLGGLGIATGIVILLSVILRIFNAGEGVPSFLPGLFPILAGMVVAFIAQSFRHEEKRAHLLMSGSLTPTQLATVTALLPVCLVGFGALAVPAMIVLAYLLSAGSVFPLASVSGVMLGQFLIYAQIGPVVQEAVAAHQQGRTRAAIAGWAAQVLLVPLLISAYWLEDRPLVFIPSYLAISMVLFAATVALYRGRTDFSR